MCASGYRMTVRQKWVGVLGIAGRWLVGVLSDGCWWEFREEVLKLLWKLRKGFCRGNAEQLAGRHRSWSGSGICL